MVNGKSIGELRRDTYLAWMLLVIVTTAIVWDK